MDDLAHTPEATLQELASGLRELYGNRYRGLVLYGSYARGEADEGSDVDLLLLLTGPVKAGKEIRRASALVSRLSLDSDHVLSVIPVDARDYHDSREPYLENARREGWLLTTVAR
jgi:predicted nucleotidyltransferase